MAEGVDYQAVLADLRARRDVLDEAIRVLESVANLGSGTGSITPRGGVSNQVIRSDSFYGMSVPQATLRYLAMTNKEPKEPTEIIEALKSGGVENANYTNVYTALKRLRIAGEVVKLPSGEWGLTEWYPGARRPKKSKSEDQGAEEDDEVLEEVPGDSAEAPEGDE